MADFIALDQIPIEYGGKGQSIGQNGEYQQLLFIARQGVEALDESMAQISGDEDILQSEEDRNDGVEDSKIKAQADARLIDSKKKEYEGMSLAAPVDGKLDDSKTDIPDQRPSSASQVIGSDQIVSNDDSHIEAKRTSCRCVCQ